MPIPTHSCIWQVTVFDDWQLAQYDCPAKLVRYCTVCGRTESSWPKSLHGEVSTLYCEDSPWHPRFAPFSVEDYEASLQLSNEFVNTLPDGIDPRSKEAALIHWKQSFQH